MFEDMTFELDHLFICTSVNAPAADALVALGLTEGTPNVHAGQGTSNRRFFFCNAMLELLWIDEPKEARSEPLKPTYLWERWAGRSNGVCPFGLCFRPGADHIGGPPFSTWEYRPPYLPPPLSIHVATNASMLTEPMLFYLAGGRRPDSYPTAERQRLEHAAGLSEITRLELISPQVGSLSPEMQVLESTSLVRLRAGTEHLLELGFDGERQGKEADFRPALPLSLHW